MPAGIFSSHAAITAGLTIASAKLLNFSHNLFFGNIRRISTSVVIAFIYLAGLLIEAKDLSGPTRSVILVWLPVWTDMNCFDALALLALTGLSQD
jgi:hypothetical protein